MDAPIVVLISFRPEREAVSWGFKEWVEAELAAARDVLELEPLSAGQSDELIGAFLPVPGMTDAERRRILGKTEGNPLFLQEVARALIDGGCRRARGRRLAADRERREVAIPDTIQSLITVGLDRLPGDGSRDGADRRRHRPDVRRRAPRRRGRPSRTSGTICTSSSAAT